MPETSTADQPPDKIDIGNTVADGAQPKPGKPEKKKKTVREQIFGPIRKLFLPIVLSWGALFGGAVAYDNVIGDGPKPTLNNISVEYKDQINANSTKQMMLQMSGPNRREFTREEIWANMQPTMKLLHSLSPEVHDWAQQMYASGQMKFDQGPVGANTCTFDVISRELKIFKIFFMSNDGQKASILVHEYWHSRQNAGKHVARVLSPKTLFAPFIEKAGSWVGVHYEQGALIYGSKVEDEAHQLEFKAAKAMGVNSGADLYLRERGICTDHDH